MRLQGTLHKFTTLPAWTDANQFISRSECWTQRLQTLFYSSQTKVRRYFTSIHSTHTLMWRIVCCVDESIIHIPRVVWRTESRKQLLTTQVSTKSNHPTIHAILFYIYYYTARLLLHQVCSGSWFIDFTHQHFHVRSFNFSFKKYVL